MMMTTTTAKKGLHLPLHLLLLLSSSSSFSISGRRAPCKHHGGSDAAESGVSPTAAPVASSSSSGTRRSWLSWSATAAAAVGLLHPAAAAALESDEYTITVEEGSIGIELEDIERFRNVGKRVQVKRLVPGGQAEMAGTVSKGDILVSVNGVSLEQEDVKKAYAVIASMPRPLVLTLRQPGKFTALLTDPRNAVEGATVSTSVAPPPQQKAAATPFDNLAGATSSSSSSSSGGGEGGVGGGDDGASSQVVKVTRTNIPKECVEGAAKGDLLEISYTGRLAEDGMLFDGTAVKVNGRVNSDSTIFFVLGNQPFGQFPPSWDLGLEGMCIGERRTLNVPPALGFGPKGVPRRRIPPNAELIYDVTLLSINGVAINEGRIELPDRGVAGLGGAYDGGGR